MNWRSCTAVGVLAILATGCENIPFIGGGSETAADSAAADSAAQAEAQAQPAAGEAQPQPAAEPAAPPQPEPAPAEPEAAEPAAPEPDLTPMPSPPPAQPQVVSSVGEEPWTPTHTGTVQPGMSSEQVIQTWGEPVVDRTVGAWTYLYFRNGCERRCGTFDLVILENDQVVDAIVRGPGHTYAGVSSSPPNTTAEFTPPDTQSAPDTTGVIG